MQTEPARSAFILDFSLSSTFLKYPSLRDAKQQSFFSDENVLMGGGLFSYWDWCHLDVPPRRWMMDDFRNTWNRRWGKAELSLEVCKNYISTRELLAVFGKYVRSPYREEDKVKLSDPSCGDNHPKLLLTRTIHTTTRSWAIFEADMFYILHFAHYNDLQNILPSTMNSSEVYEM